MVGSHTPWKETQFALGTLNGLRQQMTAKLLKSHVYGNAVNGGAGSGGDYWNQADLVIPGLNAGDVAPSARALVVLMTAIGLALGLVLLGVLYVFYARSPSTFTIENFWAYLKPWLTTTDHKEVGILYFLYGFIFFLVGGVLALLFRIQLALPENTFLTETEYNSFFTLHGTTMIFLAAMPMIAGFMNYVLPLQIGAKDLAFPRINAMGLWLLVFSSPLIYAGIWSGEGADITWVMYPPYSSLTEANLGAELAQYGSNPGTTAFISGILMLGASSTLGGVNFITTVFTMRAPGVGFMKMPLFAWSVFVSVFMLYMSLPAFIIGVAFLFSTTPLERSSSHQVGTVCCSSICSGSSAIQKCTWSLFLPSESFLKSSQQAHGARFSDTSPWCSLWPVSV